MNANKVSNNQNGSDVNNHLKKSISTKVIQGQRYKSLSCLYNKPDGPVIPQKGTGLSPKMPFY